jgi:hypothetical protein
MPTQQHVSPLKNGEAPPVSDVEPEICNCGALRQAARRVTRLYDDALAPAGLGVNQFSVIALTQAGKATVAKARPRWAAAQRRFESTFGKEAALELRTVLKEIATAEFG